MNGHLLGVLVAIPLVVVVAAPTVWYYNHRTDRVLRRLPDTAWGAHCIDPNNARAWRVLVVDDDSVRLEKTNGKPVRSWAWSQIAGAERADVRPGPAVISHGGFELRLIDGERIAFLLPSRSTLSYPPELVDEALSQIAHHRA